MEKVAEVLEGLREEERRLSVEVSGVRRAIAALEEVMGIVPAQAPERTEPIAPAAPDPPGPYAMFSLYEAAAAYLTAAGEPKTAREIAEALQAGGYPTRAANFRATVRTMLQRRISAQFHGIYASETGGCWYTRN